MAFTHVVPDVRLERRGDEVHIVLKFPCALEAEVAFDQLEDDQRQNGGGLRLQIGFMRAPGTPAET